MAVSLPKTTGCPTYATVDVSVKGLSAKNTIRIEGTGEGFHLDWVGLLKRTAGQDDSLNENKKR